MKELFLLPLVILSYYGVDGFNANMDNLFYFKLIILTILFKIISKHLQITEQYDELNQTDECIKPNKTEIELKTLNDRKLYKSDKDFEV